MARRRVWLTAALVALTLVIAVVAVRANTGLLTFDRPERRVGRLTPAAISIAPVSTPETRPPLSGMSSVEPSVVSPDVSSAGRPGPVPGPAVTDRPRHDPDHDGDDD